MLNSPGHPEVKPGDPRKHHTPQERIRVAALLVILCTKGAESCPETSPPL